MLIFINKVSAALTEQRVPSQQFLIRQTGNLQNITVGDFVECHIYDEASTKTRIIVPPPPLNPFQTVFKYEKLERVF